MVKYDFPFEVLLRLSTKADLQVNTWQLPIGDSIEDPSLYQDLRVNPVSLRRISVAGHGLDGPFRS